MQPLSNVINNSKDQVRQTLESFGFSTKQTFVVLSWLGMTWLPEILFNSDHNITYFSSTVGAGIWLTTFLLSAQVFGIQGVITHSMVYGTGSILGASLLLLNKQ